MNAKIAPLIAISIALLLSTTGRPVAAADTPVGPVAAPPRPASRDVLQPIGLRDVRVGGEIGRRIDVTIHNNLLVLNLEKDFIEPFLKRDHQDGYIGLGKLLDATVKLAAYSGDERALAMRKTLVDRVLQIQEPDGYLGMFRPDSRVRGLWDVHEMNYLIWGLLTDDAYFADPRSLAAATKAADYLIDHWSAAPPSGEVAQHVAVTGLERTMVALYARTGQRRYLDFCLGPRALAQWDLPIVIGRRQGIEGHMYAFFARCLAQLELGRLQPQESLLRQTDRAMDFCLAHNGLMITGGGGQWEIWTDDQDGRGELGETCSTAYQLRVYDSLLRLRDDPRYGDLMERTIHNALFAAQSPDGRRLRYFAPTEGPRVYHPTDTYCCPCNYRRIVAELPLMVYYRRGDGLTVNLYSASQVAWKMADGTPVAVRQETDYPNTGRVKITVSPDKAAAFPLRLRIPAWASGASAAVNGQPTDRPLQPGTFLEIRRTWQKEDVVTLDMPMPWRLVRGRQRQAGRVAVMRGPMVFCLNPTQNPKIEKWDGAELGRITLDPSSIGEAERDDSARPDGRCCRVQAWLPSFGLSKRGDLELKLTEFPDPAGQATYFRLRDLSSAVPDECLDARK